jgi:hypothetical protein
VKFFSNTGSKAYFERSSRALVELGNFRLAAPEDVGHHLMSSQRMSKQSVPSWFPVSNHWEG